jgi:enoyl-CoA hydratase/carnithine racemase
MNVPIPEFETLVYDEGDDGVAVVTLNRPDVHNAFNSLMQRELSALWHALRRRDDVRCIVLTGAGEKAFCTGIDRMEQMGGETDDTTDADVVGSGSTPFMFNDPGDNIGP